MYVKDQRCQGLRTEIKNILQSSIIVLSKNRNAKMSLEREHPINALETDREYKRRSFSLLRRGLLRLCAQIQST